MIDKFTSEKIKVMSFLSIILVLYIHSGFHDYPNEIAGMPFNHVLQKSISGMLGRIAVPLFYMISGFLFFQNVESLNDVLKKMKKRVRTLVVPFFIAALFMPAFLWGMSNIPFAAQFFNGGGVDYSNMPIRTLLCSLFFMTADGDAPIAFHLWFLRDLIVIVAASPLLYCVKKRVNGGGNFCSAPCNGSCI